MEHFVRAKLHGLRITGADLNYHGSITLDPDHCHEVGLRPLEMVEVWNKNSGARLSTYVIHGERGSRCCVLNGAAARTCQNGDEMIIAASHFGSVEDIIAAAPKVLIFNENNEVTDRLQYSVFYTADGELDMRVMEIAAAGD